LGNSHDDHFYSTKECQTILSLDRRERRQLIHTDKKRNLHMNIIIKRWVYTVNTFQLHRFTTSENITKSFRGATTFLTHTVGLRDWESILMHFYRGAFYAGRCYPRDFCPSVCLSIRVSNAWIVIKRNKLLPKFLYHIKRTFI